MERRCWNCRRSLDPVWSDGSGKKFCMACGAAVRKVNHDEKLGKAHLHSNARRREDRYDIHYKVACHVDSAEKAFDGVFVNISENGLCLKLSVSLATDQIIRIKDALVSVMACNTASVRWVSKEPDGTYLIGASCQRN